MIQVIRIEHKNGYGVFRAWSEGGNDARDFCEDLVDRHYNFPVPEKDNLDLFKQDKDWFCAYLSIEQIQEWIKPEEFKLILENNFKIYLLDVTEYQIGEYQVLFTKESILNKKDISQLFINKTQ